MSTDQNAPIAFSPTMKMNLQPQLKSIYYPSTRKPGPIGISKRSRLEKHVDEIRKVK